MSPPARKLVVASTFPIHPPRHGGQQRSFHLYRALAPEFETVVVSLGLASQPPFSGEIAPGVREVRVPMSPRHAELERELQEAAGTAVTDVALADLAPFTPEYGAAIAREAADAWALVASHPYPFPLLEPLGLPVWYEAQDFEAHLKHELFAPRPGGEALARQAREVEARCARAAQFILCAAPGDAEQVASEYGVPRERILDVPNGADVRAVPFADASRRAALKSRMGLAGTPLAFFMGSGHWPNVEAVRRLVEIAREVPEAAFVVIGNVCHAFDPARVPRNVLLAGEVDEAMREVCLQACDLAVNPMEHGSGTSLKMFDYFAAGMPVVTTAAGSRGIAVEDGTHCRVREGAQFPAAIREALFTGAPESQAMARRARDWVEREHDWTRIVARVKPRLLAAS